MLLKKTLGLVLITLLLQYSIASNVMASGHDEQILVDVSWLVKHRNDSGIVIVDARPEKEYLAGHIAGAVNIPVSKTFNPLQNTDRVGNLLHIQNLFRDAGVRNDHAVVIYDGSSYIDAGRVFWVFEVYGHKQVKLLNGGFLGWREYSGESLSKSLREIKKSDYIPAIEPDRLITKFSMRLALEDKNKVIIDTRATDEYEGSRSIAKRSGHIPGAVSIPWDKNFVDIGGIKMLKPASELQELYNDVAQNKQVYLYCNKGKQSSLSYTVMRQLGYDAAHYDGSWYEWGNDFALPIE